MTEIALATTSAKRRTLLCTALPRPEGRPTTRTAACSMTGIEEIAGPGTTEMTRKSLIDHMPGPPDTEPNEDAEGEI